MTGIIFDHGGTIDAFLGDAILAVFGAPNRYDDDPERAVRCALAMRGAISIVNEANEAAGLPRLQHRVALNTGSVIAGNIGSEQRAKYGCVGHAMNVASRIEGRPTRTKSSFSRQKKRYLKTFSFGEAAISVKGIVDAIVTYPVLGLGEGHG